MNAIADLADVFATLPGYHDEKDGKPFARSYIGWAPGDDYMGDSGWSENLTFATWDEFRGFTQGDPDLNVVADFYFRLIHDAVKCKACEGSGLNPETQQIAEDFYDFARTGRRWCDRITQDEVEALVEHNRLGVFTREFVPGEGWKDRHPPYMPTADEVNAAERKVGLMVHDAINRWILVETRAKRLGVYGRCTACGGGGEIRTGPDRLEMLLWVLHPRKGASRGVTIWSVEPERLGDVKTYLRACHQHAAMRFAWALTESK